MKRMIAIMILLTVLLSFNITYATETTKSGDLAADNEYTVEKLQEIAVGSSRQALIDDVDIKKKEMSVRTIRADTNAMSDSIQSITKPVDVKLELDAAKRTKQDHMNQLKVDVYKVAMKVQLGGKEIDLQEQKLVLANERLEMAKARFKASTITQDDVDSAQYNVESSKVNLTNAKEKLNSLYLELKKLLNQPLDTTPVKITGDLKLVALEDIDVDFALNSLYKTETSVYRAAGKLDIAQTAMDIAAKLYRKGDLVYDNSVMDLEEAKLDLAGAKTALDVKVKNKYNDMVNMLDNVELTGKYAELAKKKLANAQIKYDKGTISKEAYMSAKEALLDAEYAKVSGIVDFNGVKAEFQNMLGLK